MNIIEKYIEINKKFIILISGFKGTGKNKISKFLSKILKFELIKLQHFYIKNKNKSNIAESIDWVKLADRVRSAKGVIIVGFGFPVDSYSRYFSHDIHINLKLSKEKILEKCNNECKKKKKLILSNYYKYRDKGNISKYINVTDKTELDTKKSIFMYIMAFTNKQLLSHKK